MVSAIARHGTIKEDGGKLVKYLMDNSHWSPLQHITFSFKIQTSRAISAQIFRHRSLHFQETSQRYQQIQSFEDIELRKEHTTNRQSSEEVFNPTTIYDDCFGSGVVTASKHIEYVLRDVRNAYEELLKAGVARECARMILPMCSSTTIHVTGTLRDLLAFLNVRCGTETQKELREIALEMGNILEKEVPNIMNIIDWRKGHFM